SITRSLRQRRSESRITTAWAKSAVSAASARASSRPTPSSTRRSANGTSISASVTATEATPTGGSPRRSSACRWAGQLGARACEVDQLDLLNNDGTVVADDFIGNTSKLFAISDKDESSRIYRFICKSG